MRFTFLFFCAFIRATFVATFVFCLHISAPTTVNLFCRCAVKADEASSNDTVFVLVPPSPYCFSLSPPCSTAVHVRRRLAFSSCVLIHILYRFVPQPAELESWSRAGSSRTCAPGRGSRCAIVCLSLFPSHSHSTGVWHKCLYKKKSTFICEHAVNCKLHS